jgi:hypothetical protein
MNDPEVEKTAAKARKTKEAWIAAHLDRSESAVKQHWEIMKRSANLSQGWSSRGRVVPSTKQGITRRKTGEHCGARIRAARLTKVMDATARSKPASTRRPHTPQADEKVYDGEEEWEVEEISDHRTLDGSRPEYLVKWKTGEETWEPLENVAETVALERYGAISNATII